LRSQRFVGLPPSKLRGKIELWAQAASLPSSRSSPALHLGADPTGKRPGEAQAVKRDMKKAARIGGGLQGGPVS
jgi:hypothetical protein